MCSSTSFYLFFFLRTLFRAIRLVIVYQTWSHAESCALWPLVHQYFFFGNNPEPPFVRVSGSFRLLGPGDVPYTAAGHSWLPPRHLLCGEIFCSSKGFRSHTLSFPEYQKHPCGCPSPVAVHFPYKVRRARSFPSVSSRHLGHFHVAATKGPGKDPSVEAMWLVTACNFENSDMEEQLLA